MNRKYLSLEEMLTHDNPDYPRSEGIAKRDAILLDRLLSLPELVRLGPLHFVKEHFLWQMKKLSPLERSVLLSFAIRPKPLVAHEIAESSRLDSKISHVMVRRLVQKEFIKRSDLLKKIDNSYEIIDPHFLVFLVARYNLAFQRTLDPKESMIEKPNIVTNFILNYRAKMAIPMEIEDAKREECTLPTCLVNPAERNQEHVEESMLFMGIS